MRLLRALTRSEDDVAKQIKCPQCGGEIERVRQSEFSALNADQFDSVKAGDWFCVNCPSNNRGQMPLCYWWERELPDAIEYVI